MKYFTVLLATTLLLVAPQAQCRDTKHMFSIQRAMESNDFKQKLDPNIRLYFGKQKHPEKINYFGQFASYYKKNTVSSETEYECHAGAVIAGVALIGDVVTLAE